MVFVMRKRRNERKLARLLLSLDDAARDARPWWRVRRVSRGALGTSRA
jgi:hypothetical protein